MRQKKYKFEFKAFGWNIYFSMSTFRRGYKKGEKVEEKPCAEQLDMFDAEDKIVEGRN